MHGDRLGENDRGHAAGVHRDARRDGHGVPRARDTSRRSARRRPDASRVLNVATGQAVQAEQVLIELDQAPFQAALQSAERGVHGGRAGAPAASSVWRSEGIVAAKRSRAGGGRDGEGARRRRRGPARRAAVAAAIADRRRRDAHERHARRVGRSVAAAGRDRRPERRSTCCSAVTPTDAARVRPGAKVSLSAGQAGGGEPLGVGTVVGSRRARSTRRRAASRSACRRRRRAGRCASVRRCSARSRCRSRASAIVVPLEALVPEGDDFNVFVVDAQRHRARARGEGRRQDEHVGRDPRGTQGRRAGRDLRRVRRAGQREGRAAVRRRWRTARSPTDEPAKSRQGRARRPIRRRSRRSRDGKRSLFELLARAAPIHLSRDRGAERGRHLGGVLSCRRRSIPSCTFPRITIVAQGSSLGARQVLFSITRPIEEAISIVPGVTRVQSRSIRGGSETNINFAPKHRHDLRAAAGAGAREPDARRPAGRTSTSRSSASTPSLFPILSYNLRGRRSGDAVRHRALSDQAADLARARRRARGRAGQRRARDRGRSPIRRKLAAQQMTYADLAAAIQSATTVDAVGRMPQDYQQYLIVTTTKRTRSDDIANIVVAHGLRVRDLATVRAGHRGPRAHRRRRRQAGGAASTSRGRSAATRSRSPTAWRGSRRALRKTLPPGVVLKPVYDQAALVRDAVKSVRDAMLIGAALAVVVLLLFLRHARITAISASSIPITMAITVFVMSLRRADVQPDDARRDGDRDRPRDRRRGGDHREHRAPRRTCSPIARSRSARRCRSSSGR